MESEVLVLKMIVSCIELTYLLVTVTNPRPKNSFKCYCLKALVSNLKMAGNMSLVRRERNLVTSNLSGFSTKSTSIFQQNKTHGKIELN